MVKFDKLLVLNVGSSSLKFCLFERKNCSSLISGKCDGIGLAGSFVEYKDKFGREHKEKKKILDYNSAVKILIEILKKETLSLDAIAHRVVHGGNLRTVKIDSRNEKIMKDFSKFAPLHNPLQIKVIDILKKFKKPQYAVFDTTFFIDLPKVSQIYPIASNVSKKFNLRRYGFQGISHQFVSRNLKGKTISCHLGSGCSVAAIKNGKPLDTSMGMTPLEGLMMRTRSGNLDPGIVLFLQKKGYDVDKLLRKESGFKGISGMDDFRDILKTMSQNKKSKLAYDMFVYSLSKTIASYLPVLGGVDNLIFTAAIGENVAMLRKDVCDNLGFLGIVLDNKKNKKNEEKISNLTSKVKVFVKPTNEELMIAREVFSRNGK